MKLTGKSIFNSNQEPHKAITWDELQPESRAIYERAAVNLDKDLHYEEMQDLARDLFGHLQKVTEMLHGPAQLGQDYVNDALACRMEAIGLLPARCTSCQMRECICEEATSTMLYVENKQGAIVPSNGGLPLHIRDALGYMGRLEQDEDDE